MYLTFHCPKCEQSSRAEEVENSLELGCKHCDWKRDISPSTIHEGKTPKECLRCGNSDLWRQKSFPQSLGLFFVALGAVTSSIAWAYHRPILALSILMGFALLDMVLYITMPDVLVCYRCQSKHHSVDVSSHNVFDHEVGERYRQERIQLEQAERESKQRDHSEPDPKSNA